MWLDRQQHGFNGGCFEWLQFIGQLGFLAVQFEFVDEHAREVAFLFFAQLRILKNGLDGFIQCFLSRACSFLATRLNDGEALTCSISQTHKAQPVRL